MASSRRQYPFHLIEPKWQQAWDEQQAFRAFNPGETVPAAHPFGIRHGLSGKKADAQALPPKFYILDMFPYPSGAGLHVGHPEGYTATDILARYKRACGLHVLHPMGWDAFGLPAEQYAVKTGQHPRVTTEQNIANFTRQIKSLGFSYDWSREVNTTDPDYFKWTQWIFLKLYNSYFDWEWKKATPIELLEDALSDNPKQKNDWKNNPFLLGTHDGYVSGYRAGRDEARRRLIERSRLAYVTDAPVWWCEALGTVLANEEVVDGKSEVGGHPVTRKPMRQWMLRITAYAERLLQDLDTIDWSDSLKEMQRNWIGRSEGAEVDFQIAGSPDKIRVFTTRPDTLFGATYMVLSPEHKLVEQITTPEQRAAIQAYKAEVSKKSDLERTELAKEKSGVFTGAYAINPVNGERIPIWIADYVLASYGTGAIMAVPAHDTRDFEFATKFNLPIVQVVQPPDPKTDWHGFVDDGTSVNSTAPEVSITGLPTPEAKKKITAWLESKGLGKKTINYKLRDWLFSRQRYWGEPFPIVWRRDADGSLYHEALPESALPLLPPEMTDYKPTATGEPPLARAKDWVNLPDGSTRELNTMPQWAGSCWYYLRYLDAQNCAAYVGREAEKYWMGSYVPPLPAKEQWPTAIEELLRYVEGHEAGTRRRLAFAYVGEAQAETLKRATGLDLRGRFHVIDNYAINYVTKTQGSFFVDDPPVRMAVYHDDFVHLPAIIESPDEIQLLGKTERGFDILGFSKFIDGVLFVVEELVVSRNLMAVATMYKNHLPKATVTRAAIGASVFTSETRRRMKSLAHSQPAYNPNFSGIEALSKAHLDSIGCGASTTPGVDLYVGGTEHAVLHLLYARFWHKVLFDLGFVSTPEPFFKLVNQGLILGEDGQKMSKSRGNVVNPDDILTEFGADAFRLYEMFMGPLQDTKPWNTRGVEGVYRFLGRVWRLFVDEQSETEFEQAETLAAPGSCGCESAEQTADRRDHSAESCILTNAATNAAADLLYLIKLNPAIKDVPATSAQLKTLHACIKKVTEDLDGMRFNTAISAMMVFVNEATTWETKPVSALRTFLQLLQPFAPHIAEELWQKLNIEHQTSNAEPPASLPYAPWPQFDPALLVEDTLEIPVQVNGKLRDVIRVPANADNATLEAAAKTSEKVQPFLAGKTIKKVIVVPKKLVNIAVA